MRGAGHVAWYPVAMDAVSVSDGDAVPKAIAKWKQREDQTQMKLSFEYSQNSQQAAPELLCNAMLGKAITGEAGAGQNPTLQCLFASLRTCTNFRGRAVLRAQWQGRRNPLLARS